MKDRLCLNETNVCREQESRDGANLSGDYRKYVCIKVKLRDGMKNMRLGLLRRD